MDNESKSNEDFSLFDSELKLYSLLVKQFHNYQTLIWQIPTALLLANFIILDKFYDNVVPLIILLFFDIGLTFVFQRMIRSQRLIMTSLRNAEKKIRRNYPHFIIPFRQKSKFNASYTFLVIIWALEIGLVFHIINNTFKSIPNNPEIQNCICPKQNCAGRVDTVVINNSDTSQAKQLILNDINNELKKQTGILDTIAKHHSYMTVGSDIEKAGINIPIWVVLISVLILCIGILIMLVVKKPELIILGRILFSLGGISLISELSLGGLTFEYTNSPTSPPNNYCQFEYIGTVGPFKEATDSLINRSSLDDVVHSLRNISANNIKSLILIGRADKNRLKPIPAAILGSNENLSRKRASYVRNQILKYIEFSPLVKRIIRLTSGADHTGFSVPESLLSQDRCVDIYINYCLQKTN